MNAESRPLKHDHPQYYADHRRAVAAADADAPCRTTTKTTIVTRRRAIAVCVVVAAVVVAGVTYLSTGLDPRSPVVVINHRDDSAPSGATGGVLREGFTTTGTKALDNDTDDHPDDEPLTREAFIAQYPELRDISPEHQTVQYEAYLLYLNGMTVKELDAYYDINDDGQQEGGRAGATGALINGGQQENGRAGATSVFKCCLDDVNSCNIRFQEVIDQVRAKEMSLPNNVFTQDDVCAWVSRENPDVECVPAGYAKYRICCRSFPDSRVGSKFWVFNGCT